MRLSSEGIPIADEWRIRDLKVALLKEGHPSRITGGRKLMGGSQQNDNIYRFGDYIVKKSVGPAFWSSDNFGSFSRTFKTYIVPIRGLRRLGLARPRYWQVNQWVIQPYYGDTYSVEKPKYKSTKEFGKPALYRGKWLDEHGGNRGVNRYGYAVAYDW